MKFSERIGKINPKTQIQIDSIDKDLRNSLWNIIDICLKDPIYSENSSRIKDSDFYDIIFSIWFNHFKEPLDSMPIARSDVFENIRFKFFSWDYLAVYDFIDFIASIKCDRFDNNLYIMLMNNVLERELSGYRFVNKQLVPITNEIEIKTIESAIKNGQSKNLTGVSYHLEHALQKLSDRKKPDYRNSIKESISAVESLCQVICNEPKTELSKTLSKLKKHFHLHAALEQGFIKLYSYTSDDQGIRHALLDEPNLDQEDALYMLVTCSAFINYLISKASRSGVLSA